MTEKMLRGSKKERLIGELKCVCIWTLWLIIVSTLCFTLWEDGEHEVSNYSRSIFSRPIRFHPLSFVCLFVCMYLAVYRFTG